eukprot:4044273-Prymnesium_polylepis.1
MGWSGAPIPPLKAAQGHRVVEKGAELWGVGSQRHIYRISHHVARLPPASRTKASSDTMPPSCLPVQC